MYYGSLLDLFQIEFSDFQYKYDPRTKASFNSSYSDSK